MNALRIPVAPLPVTRESRWRHGYTLAAVVVAVALISWGGLVTSIDAGLAVPDWPTSFGSYDPFATGFEDPTDPGARWWHRLPILAEHGHRLLGALVGLLVVGLTVWTWRAERRSWMRWLGIAALGLVIVQGILGGLRVIWVSLDLAVVHACLAQIFFSVLVAMALFTSRGWLEADQVGGNHDTTPRLRGLAYGTVGALYLQIILGALLRHPGTGVNLFFAGIHIAGAMLVIGLVLATFVTVRRHFSDHRLLDRAAWWMLATAGVQILLGFIAFTVLLVDYQAARRSVIQVVLNSTHLVVGALLMASAVCLALLAARRSRATRTTLNPSSPMAPVGA